MAFVHRQSSFVINRPYAPMISSPRSHGSVADYDALVADAIDIAVAAMLELQAGHGR